MSHGWTASVAHHSKDSSDIAIPSQTDVDNLHLDSHYSSAEAATSIEGGRTGTAEREAGITEAMTPEAEEQKHEREDDIQSIDSMTVDAGPSKRARRLSSSSSSTSSAWSTTAVHHWPDSESDGQNLSHRTQRQGRNKRVKGGFKKSTSIITHSQRPPYRNMQITVAGYYKRARQEKHEREASYESGQRRSHGRGLGHELERPSATETAEGALRNITRG